MNYSKYLLSLGLVASLNIGTAEAKLVFFEYTNTQGNTSVVPLQPFINGSEISVGVSAGLDRKTRLILRDVETNNVVYSKTSNYVTVSDRVMNPSGDDFYGHKFKLPSLSSDTTYSLTQEVLDLNGGVVYSEASKFTIDITPLQLNPVINISRNGIADPADYSFEGEQVILRRFSSHLEVPFSFSGSAPKSGTWKVYEKKESGWVFYKSYDAEFSVTENGGSVYFRRLGHASGEGGMRPILPNYSGRFRFVLELEDGAGNISTVSTENHWVTCNISSDIKYGSDKFKIVGITDKNSSGIEGINNSSGYRAFSPGDVITQNPVSIIVAIPIEYSRVANPLYGYSLDAIRFNNISPPLATDDEFAYYKTSSTTAQLDGSLVHRRIYTGGELCSGYLNVGSNFSEASRPPNITAASLSFDGEEYGYNHTGRSEFSDAVQAARETLPKGAYYTYYVGRKPWTTLNSATITVEPRSYEQQLFSRFDTNNRCTVPAGGTSCTVTYNKSIVDLNGFWVHSTNGFYAQSSVGTSYKALILKVDTDAPEIQTLDFTPQFSLLSGRIYNTSDADYYGNRTVTSIIARATRSDGVVTDITGTKTSAKDDGRYIDYQVDLKSLNDGLYSFELLAYDQAGNLGSKRLTDSIQLDTTPPLVKLYNNGEVHSLERTVNGLESLSMKVEDTSSSSVVSIRLIGGPTNDSLIMDWIALGDNQYTLEYPRIFPNLEPGYPYTLRVDTKDIYNNSAYYDFQLEYMPANIVQLKKSSVLPTEVVLRNGDDIPIYQISTNQLRDNEGQLVTDDLPVAFTVRSDSETSLIVDSRTVLPGETVEWNYDVSRSNGVVELPITVKTDSDNATADFMFEISGVSVGSN